MRVITGSARGRKLLQPANREIRPTTDQVKEALFNIVQFDLEGRRVLDLFAGTGQLGIEALSRGAASCLFLDESREAVEPITKFDSLSKGGIMTVESRRETPTVTVPEGYGALREYIYGKIKLTVVTRGA